MTTKKATKKTPAKKAASKKSEYRPREGTSKEKVWNAFHAKGRDAAIALGEKLKLAPTTARGWASQWAKGVEQRP